MEEEKNNATLPIPPQESESSLRNQLNEATSRWRREERRAKAREEELEASLTLERNQLTSLSRDLDQMKLELDAEKEKNRESNRKKQQAHAINLRLEQEVNRLRLVESQKEETDRELNKARAEYVQLEEAFTVQEGEMFLCLTSKRELEEEVQQLTADLQIARQEKDAVLVLQTRLEHKEKEVEQLHMTMKHNAHLVRELQTELSQWRMTPPPAPPVSLPVTLVKDLATRLELLLKENASLLERIAFLEQNVQSLTEELVQVRNPTPH